MNMTLQIDRLILEGIELPRGEEPRLRAILESELARLFGGGAASRDGGATASLARQIAAAVHAASTSTEAKR